MYRILIVEGTSRHCAGGRRTGRKYVEDLEARRLCEEFPECSRGIFGV